LKGALSWAPKGHVVAREQFQLPVKPVPPVSIHAAAMPAVDIDERSDPAKITISGKNFSITFSKQNGLMESYVVDGRPLIASPPRPNFWRALTENDKVGMFPIKLGYFAPDFQDEFKKFKSIVAEQVSRSVVKVVSREDRVDSEDGEHMSECSITYTILGGGDMHVHFSFTTGSPVPRIGFQLAVPGTLRTMTWLGLGPHETYLDRRASGIVGLYSGKVDDLIYDYIVPSENGNRMGTRWFSLQDASGDGVIFAGSQLLEVSAWPYTMDRLARARHINELRPFDENITVNVDLKQMGIGSETGCGCLAPARFQVPAGAYSYGFYMHPYRKVIGELAKVARQTFVLD
nr:hypothetical protein [Candidatus Sigynarchaeota archaeon]